MRRILSVGLASIVSMAGLVALPSGGAGAAGNTYYMCQNKKSGALRLVPKGTKCKKKEKKIKGKIVAPQGPAGSQGSPGPQGPQGDAGARGPAGAFQAIDQTGKVIGTLVGLFPPSNPVVRLPSGVLLIWNNVPTDPNAVMLNPPVLYYKQAGCVGDAYGNYSPSYPFDLGIVMAPTAVPGAEVYRLSPGTAQAFTSLSYRDPSGCTSVSTGVSGAYVAKPAGTVPAVAQPMYYEPQS